jgi:hypothetical protein
MLLVYPEPKEADVPSGVFPIPKFRSRPRRTIGKRPSLAVRVRTRWRRSRLDDELARGTVPGDSAALTLRGVQLRSPAERSRLANRLLEALGAARGPNLGAFTKKARRRDAQIRESADDLLALVQRLRDERPADLRGAAMTARLVTDARSPLHRVGDQDLGHEIRAARAALDAARLTPEHLAAAA